MTSKLRTLRDRALRVGIGGLIVVAAVAYGSRERPRPTVSLPGVWVGDPDRLDSLWVVSSEPPGPDREQAKAQAYENMRGLVIEFTDDTATLRTPTMERSLTYRIKHVAGPMVVLEGLHEQHWVETSLQVEGDRLTWYDAQGEVEFVLRRQSAEPAAEPAGPTER